MAGRKSAQEVIALVMAALVGLLLLAIGLQAWQTGRESGGAIGAEYRIKELGDYSQLKVKCAIWREPVENCPESYCTPDCQACMEMFMSDAVKLYSLPYYVEGAKLKESVYYSADSSKATEKCANAVNVLAKEPQGEPVQAILELGSGIKKDSTLAAETAEACSKVCTWVYQRDEECRNGVEECAEIATAEGGIPYYLLLP